MVGNRTSKLLAVNDVSTPDEGTNDQKGESSAKRKKKKSKQKRDR